MKPGELLLGCLNFVALILIALVIVLILSVDNVHAADPPILPMPSPWPSASTKPWRTAPPRPVPIVVGLPAPTGGLVPALTPPPTDTE